jgi:hypothetical protein
MDFYRTFLWPPNLSRSLQLEVPHNDRLYCTEKEREERMERDWSIKIEFYFSSALNGADSRLKRNRMPNECEI